MMIDYDWRYIHSDKIISKVDDDFQPQKGSRPLSNMKFCEAYSMIMIDNDFIS